LETFWPASDGWSAARIEEQLVVTKEGCQLITRFPAEELMVAGVKYYTATGPLSNTRDTESYKNIDYRKVQFADPVAVPASIIAGDNGAKGKRSGNGKRGTDEKPKAGRVKTKRG
jgi:hypothetical protein